MGTVRQASHAGSWYSARGPELDRQLAGWLSAVPASYDNGVQVPVTGLKAIIAPHAGYSYSGPTAAWAYKSIDPSRYTRVFVLGPSHHFYLDGCALSGCSSYATPLGDLPLDRATIDELKKTGQFSSMTLDVDEDEHSIEMHLPYVRKIFEGRDITVVPILVGSTSKATEKKFGELLAPYLADEQTLFVISSDFCHWGTRFRYTHYSAGPGQPATNLQSSSSSSAYSARPISESIEQLDREGMATIEFPSEDNSDANLAHDHFSDYLKETSNTICGRHPIGVLLAAVGALQKSTSSGRWDLSFVRYAQSSACRNPTDSSVSYASAICRRM